MADKKQLKIDDQVDLADDDPFAELTKIMGFDPRQPAKQAQAGEQAPAPGEQPPEEDDFSLDLEKELLGGFDLEDETADQTPPVEAAAPPVEAPLSASEPDAPEAGVPEVDFDFSADFDAAIAASSEAEVQADSEAEFDLGLTDLGLTDEDLRALDPEAAAPVEPVTIEAEADEPEADFDLGLTEDDVAALEFDAPQYDAPQYDAPQFDAPVVPEPAPAVEAFAGDTGIDADLDAAMADIDMDFLGEAAASEPVAVAPADEVVEARYDSGADIGTAEDDLHLFDEDDFRLEDEPAAIVEPEPELELEAEPQPELDESAFSFGEDELRLDDVQLAEEPGAEPAEEPAAQAAADEFSFDEVDFAADDLHVSEPEVSADPQPVAAKSHVAESAEPASSPDFEFSMPAYMPRRLPTSPMDVAAEEFRQRDVAAAPAEPEFNLEDELNALLGNIKSNQAAAAGAPEPTPAYEPPATAYEPPAYQAAIPDLYETASPVAYEPESPHLEQRPEEIVSFDAPEHPADIDDDLSWELDDVFAAEAAPVSAEEDQAEEDQPEAYADEEQPEAYAEDGRYAVYAEGERSGDGYAAEEPAPIEFEDDDFDLSAEDIQPEEPEYYDDALAGAAIGAAASRFDSGFTSRPFEAPSSTRQPERFAAAPSEHDAFSPHRDPVVRGNPLKEDPLDIITALAAKYSKQEPVTPYGRAMGVATGSTPFGDQATDDEDIDISAAFEEQPDVETVEVADRAVALADDLDIPELAEDEELPAVSAYDDLDAEFSSLLSDMNAEPRAAQPANGYDDTLDGGFSARRPYQNQMAAAPAASYQASQPARKVYDDDPEPDSFALDADDLPGSQMLSGAQFAADEYDYDPDLDQEIAAPHHMAAESRQQPKSRGMLLAALVGGVALVGAIGAFALSFGDGAGGDTPAIVRADEGPVKVKPENPGGSTVPNQDNKVYETVAGEGAAGAPQQEKLVTTAEEPVDVTPPAMEEETAAAPSGKSEDRIEQILEEAETQTDAEIVAVSPRKVRTMVVKPDGTLVPREDEPEAAAPSAEQTETIAAAVPEAVAPIVAPAATAESVPELTPESTGALPAAPEAAPAPAETPAEEAAAEPASDDAGTMPETVPIAPLRPVDQPIDVVGEVKPDQVAATTTTAAAGGNWAMQIASQPSEAAAQSSYQDLARRYGGVLEGRQVNIVKAEIAGKGTFWRVRVPANSRNEAIGLCENYKAAGGNCFVSR